MNLSQRTMGLERAIGWRRKVKCKADADMSKKVKSGHRIGRERNAEVSVGQCHDLNDER